MIPHWFVIIKKGKSIYKKDFGVIMGLTMNTTTLLVRTSTGEIRPYAVTATTTIGKLLCKYGRNCSMIHVVRDAMNRIVRTEPARLEQMAMKFVRPVIEHE